MVSGETVLSTETMVSSKTPTPYFCANDCPVKQNISMNINGFMLVFVTEFIL